MKLKVLTLVLLFFLIICIFTQCKAMFNYQIIGTSTGLVTASSLNVRKGPGTNFDIITRVYKNEYIRLFAKIGEWYVVQTDTNYLGAVNTKYVKLIYPNGASNSSNSRSISDETNNITSELTEDEKEVFNLINAKRTANGLTALKIDDEVQNVARIKAKDMVDNNYFSHTSPIYGSPFDMLKSYRISYNTAGENIAGNSTNQGAVEAWMNSSGHRANILNSSFNYTGIGVVKSQKYGKIYVQMFIGK